MDCHGKQFVRSHHSISAAIWRRGRHKTEYNNDVNVTSDMNMAGRVVYVAADFSFLIIVLNVF